MKKILFLIAVIYLFRVVSVETEASCEMDQNYAADSNKSVIESVKPVPVKTTPKIMKPKGYSAVNSNPVKKLSIEQNSDVALSTVIQQKLTGNPQLAEKLGHITIKSIGGSVILKGTVNSEEYRANIVHQVEGIAGVDHVDNQLKVGSK